MKKRTKFMLVLLSVIIVFVMHVPIARYLSGPNYRLVSYPNINSSLETENFELIKLYYGGVSRIWFDKKNKIFVIEGKVIKKQGLKPETYYLFYIDKDGSFIGQVEEQDGQRQTLDTSEQYILLSSLPEKAYRSGYYFKDSQGALDLVHFEKEKFTWPYFYYYFPVIRFDWKGKGYINLNHQTEQFKFKIPLEYDSQWLYLDGNYDGQLYYYDLSAFGTELGFFQVSESSYLSPMSGEDIHRDGYGFYLIKPKKH